MLLYAVAGFEVGLAARTALDSAIGALIILCFAAITVLLARWMWRDFEKRGPDDPRYSWRAAWRKLRDSR